uniref:DUF7730 domain-containing protein n=1 Tax=Coccidioides posadasii RMSCC 3488 TaxID=454284 RepID=A0A0J6FGY8_COCPO|nr:hypothetical protein CPAG_04476 [Coccidioides posadasii RMSCC 3488]
MKLKTVLHLFTKKKKETFRFLDLPFEIRLLVYEYVYGRWQHQSVVVINPGPKRLIGCLFQRQHRHPGFWLLDSITGEYSLKPGTCRCHEASWHHWFDLTRCKSRKSCKLNLALTYTCHQIHSESLDVMYASTGFRFHNRSLDIREHDFLAFRRTITPAHFASIPSLEITLPVEDVPQLGFARFARFCDIIAGMPRLRRLKLMMILSPRPPSGRKVQEEQVGGPLSLIVAKESLIALEIGVSDDIWGWLLEKMGSRTGLPIKRFRGAAARVLI